MTAIETIRKLVEYDIDYIVKHGLGKMTAEDALRRVLIYIEHIRPL